MDLTNHPKNDKQVFIDALANYLTDIDFNDAFRYTLAIKDKNNSTIAHVYHFES